MNTIIIAATYLAITGGLSYETEVSMLKVAYSESFSDRSVKVKIFIL